MTYLATDYWSTKQCQLWPLPHWVAQGPSQKVVSSSYNDRVTITTATPIGIHCQTSHWCSLQGSQLGEIEDCFQSSGNMHSSKELAQVNMFWCLKKKKKRIWNSATENSLESIGRKPGVDFCATEINAVFFDRNGYNLWLWITLSGRRGRGELWKALSIFSWLVTFLLLLLLS